MSERNNIEDFNDTKWYNINERIQTLIDLESELLIEQPTFVQGNNKGFDMLLDLLGRSNYTFEDLDDSLKEAYRVSLQNAMSRNVVNTHAIIFNTSFDNKKNVSADKFSHYKIIDAPWYQLHFGHRDEFIRQKLHEMHITENDHYIDIDKFNKSEIADVLDFCIICTANGFISNDCQIAIDDHGFKFKVGWKSSDKANFIVYKLDRCRMYTFQVPTSVFESHNIPYETLNGIDKSAIGSKCLINIHNSNYKTTIRTVPNFGILDSNGLNINGLQQFTKDMIKNQNMSVVNIDIYTLKYFHEIPNIYPAVDYYDIMESKVVYDEKYERLRTPEGDLVVETPSMADNKLETCTPPITIDRDTSYTFNTIYKCIHMYDKLMKFDTLMKRIGDFLLNPTTISEFNGTLKDQLGEAINDMTSTYSEYLRGAIITSLVSNDKIKSFGKFIDKLTDMYTNFTDINDSQQYSYDEFYGENYSILVDDICSPFMNDKLEPFRHAIDIQTNFFEKEDATRFNRPVSEQSLITLKYSDEYKSWIFDYPEIKHFHGIGNSFYINTGLTGKEIFKFFVLYTDTEDGMNPYIERFDFRTVVDFDLFYEEMTKYNGCIRYWDAESKLAKISNMLYRKYDDETCVHVLSKILKRKIDGDSIIELYPSDINYEYSNVTSDNIEDYTEESDRAPFSINFLFYTLSLLNNNVDKLQAYFYRDLTQKKYASRYVDVNIRELIDGNEEYPLSFAQYSISPSTFPTEGLPSGRSYLAFYGLPLITNGTNSGNLYDPYRYVLNVYDPDTEFPYLEPTGPSDVYKINYSDITDYNGQVVCHKDTIEFVRLLTEYIATFYDYTSELQTNYQKTYECTSICNRGIESLECISDKINALNDTGNIENVSFGGTSSNQIMQWILTNKIFTNRFASVRLLAERATKYPRDIHSEDPNADMDSFVKFINSVVLYNIRRIYNEYGFDAEVKDRVRAAYDHFKKINTPMNSYVYEKWVRDIDLDLFERLDRHIAYNENYTFASDYIERRIYWPLWRYIRTIIFNPLITWRESYEDHMNSITTTFYNNYTSKVVAFIDQFLKNVVFDTYILNTVDVPTLMNTTYTAIPNMLAIELPNDAHTNPPYGTTIPGTHNIFFKLVYDGQNGSYKIKSMSTICEYVFFDGTPLNNLTVKVISDTGSTIGTLTNGSLTFLRAGSTADKGEAFKQLPNTGTTVLDFENHHESFEIVSDKIVNEKTAPMNYELLLGNNFTTLDHESEYILNPITWNPGSVDRVVVENEVINKMSIADHGHKHCMHVYFKPCQVEHPTIPVNGKYFEGETVYAVAPNGYMFPIKITTVDHGMNKGMVEAEVDQWNATWFESTDNTEITNYLTGMIECEVIDDSARNFMDEYADSSMNVYNQPMFNTDVMDEDHPTCYTLPGDPLTVTSNAPYIYSRLIWMFNEDIDNRFIDEESKKYRFIYVGDGFIPTDQDVLRINMINHDFNDMTLPEKYPVLKDEPNEHMIWNKERALFEEVKYNATVTYNKLAKQYEIEKPKVEYYKEQGLNYLYRKELVVLQGIEENMKKEQDTIDRMTRLLYQMEPKTTWYNVISQKAAMIYIDNGRAERYSPSFISNIRDLLYTDKVKVYLYDWEHKLWIDPTTYDVSYDVQDGLKIDERQDYTSDNVLTSITITPNDPSFSFSKKILVYFAYDTCDVFDDVVMNSNKINVRFKPLVVLDKEDENYDPYYDIRIRKHFDGEEVYKTAADDNGEIYIKRIKRSGKYEDTPVFRLCDVSVTDSHGDHPFTHITSFKVKAPFKGLTTTRQFNTPSFTATIKAPIDSFVPNEHVKLICISNNELSSYDGNISSVMFEGTTSLNGANQAITITNSTLPNYITGTFVCTVFKDDSYDSTGGVVQIVVTTTGTDIYDDWVTVPTDYMRYRELPEEFKIKLNNPTAAGDNTTVTLHIEYNKDYSDTVNEDNSGLYNPFEYYYNPTQQKRLPISDVKRNAHDRRLVIDQTDNPDVKLVKSTYIGICRYSAARIPENGVIDMTGYLPTPLTRNRYEFWVNGRCVSGTKDLIILSPTSIQLCNMKSLRNFECIELVDDVDMDNDLMHQGNVYIDINGNTFSSFKLAMLSNSKIRNQNISFIFNANNHDKLNDYWRSVVDNPNNYDLEQDIFSTITFDDSTNDYNELFNIPTINGISLFHPKLSGLGIAEVPNIDIVKEFDRVWRIEATTNPFFMTTHRSDTHLTDQNVGLVLHCNRITEPHWHDLSIDTTGMFEIHTTGPVEKYFSLYVSRLENGAIDDVNNTVKIIPFMSSSVYILLDESYQGMYLHSTHPNTTPIHII